MGGALAKGFVAAVLITEATAAGLKLAGGLPLGATSADVKPLAGDRISLGDAAGVNGGGVGAAGTAGGRSLPIAGDWEDGSGAAGAARGDVAKAAPVAGGARRSSPEGSGCGAGGVASRFAPDVSGGTLSAGNASSSAG